MPAVTCNGRISGTGPLHLFDIKSGAKICDTTFYNTAFLNDKVSKVTVKATEEQYRGKAPPAILINCSM